jgi:sugar phosphate isomerase/epimerase
MKAKLACADFSFPLLPHEHVLDLIAMLKIPAVDIGLFEGRSHLQPSKVFRNVRQSASRLLKQLRDRGLKAADVFMHPASDFESLAPNQPAASKRRWARDIFFKTLEFTARCHGSHVTLVPGVPFPQEPKAASFGRCVEELGWRSAQAKDFGIIFGIEPHIGSIVPTPVAGARLVQSTPGLTLTLDYTHFTRMGYEDSAIEPLLKYASHFHARASRRGRLQAPWRENAIDYRRVLDVMDANRYQGYIGIEYVWIEWQHCNEVDNLSETILLRDFLLSPNHDGHN